MMATELLAKALKSIGGLEEFKRRREEFSRDLAFIENNRGSLLKEYEEQWIAVYGSKVVAHGRDYSKVLFELEREGMPVGQIPIKFLSNRKIRALY
jgi:hypothetical protein